MSWWNLAWMLAVVGVLGWLLSNLLVAVFTPITGFAKPVRERRHLLFLAGLPWFLPLLMMLALFWLALAKQNGWIPHHCMAHDPHHPHFCLEHLPELFLTLAHSVSGIGALGAAAVLFAYRLSSHYQLFVRTKTLSRFVKGPFVRRTLKEESPLAFTVGIRKPVVFISEGLKKKLSKRELRMVVKHEVAHIRHRDVLKNTLYEVLLGIHLFPETLRSRWYLTNEFNADDRVGDQFDSLEVAELLIKLNRMGVNCPFPVSIAGGTLKLRVRRLLGDKPSAERRVSSAMVLYALVFALPAVLVASHHNLETFFGWLL